ncbi:unnamed protein product, partial [Dibothriocephalus latus]
MVLQAQKEADGFQLTCSVNSCMEDKDDASGSSSSSADQACQRPPGTQISCRGLELDRLSPGDKQDHPVVLVREGEVVEAWSEILPDLQIIESSQSSLTVKIPKNVGRLAVNGAGGGGVDQSGWSNISASNECGDETNKSNGISTVAANDVPYELQGTTTDASPSRSHPPSRRPRSATPISLWWIYLPSSPSVFFDDGAAPPDHAAAAAPPRHR